MNLNEAAQPCLKCVIITWERGLFVQTYCETVQMKRSRDSLKKLCIARRTKRLRRSQKQKHRTRALEKLSLSLDMFPSELDVLELYFTTHLRILLHFKHGDASVKAVLNA